MQRAQRHVIKLILIYLFYFSNNCFGQEVNDDYELLFNVIENTINSNDSIYSLSENKLGNYYYLRRYYNFRTKNKPLYTTFLADSNTNEIEVDSVRLKKNIAKWKVKYNLLDSLFSEEDIEYIIGEEYIESKKKDSSKFLICSTNTSLSKKEFKNSEKWNSSHDIFNRKKLKIKWCKKSCENYISKPYYDKKKEHAFIVYVKKEKNVRYNPTYFFYIRKNNNWVFINKIENFGF